MQTPEAKWPNTGNFPCQWSLQRVTKFVVIDQPILKNNGSLPIRNQRKLIKKNYSSYAKCIDTTEEKSNKRLDQNKQAIAFPEVTWYKYLLLEEQMLLWIIYNSHNHLTFVKDPTWEPWLVHPDKHKLLETSGSVPIWTQLPKQWKMRLIVNRKYLKI